MVIDPLSTLAASTHERLWYDEAWTLQSLLYKEPASTVPCYLSLPSRFIQKESKIYEQVKVRTLLVVSFTFTPNQKNAHVFMFY